MSWLECSPSCLGLPVWCPWGPVHLLLAGLVGEYAACPGPHSPGQGLRAHLAAQDPPSHFSALQYNIVHSPACPL